jgi:hypothetical protein
MAGSTTAPIIDWLYYYSGELANKIDPFAAAEKPRIGSICGTFLDMSGVHFEEEGWLVIDRLKVLIFHQWGGGLWRRELLHHYSPGLNPVGYNVI